MTDRPPAPRYDQDRPIAGPPADDDRDPVDPRPASSRPAPTGATSMLNARISAEHRRMIDEVLADRDRAGDSRTAKVRFVVEDLIEAGYRDWTRRAGR